jgi:ABC-type antimicrobial peptide transport system permease subunit
MVVLNGFHYESAVGVIMVINLFYADIMKRTEIADKSAMGAINRPLRVSWLMC